MYGLNNLLLVLVILLNFFTLGSSRLGACVRAVALQGAILAVLPVTIHGPSPFMPSCWPLARCCSRGFSSPGFFSAPCVRCASGERLSL